MKMVRQCQWSASCYRQSVWRWFPASLHKVSRPFFYTLLRLFVHAAGGFGEDVPKFRRPGGLRPTWDLFASRPQGQACIHVHILSITRWTMAQLIAHDAEFTTRTHATAHAWNGMRVMVAWRMG